MLAHIVVVGIVVKGVHRAPEIELVDIELAPAPPVAEALPEEIARQIEQAAEDKARQEAAALDPAAKDRGEREAAVIDAGVDHVIDPVIDAARVGKKHPDAAVVDAAAIDAAVDAALIAADPDGGPGSGSEDDVARLGSGRTLGSGSAGSGSPAAIATGSGSGVAAMDDQPAVEGATTSAGTAANLLAYFPAGHLVSVLVRFDRLRGTEWAKAAEDVFRPMPDYRGLFGARSAEIATKLDMLVISTPRPRDATATTLVIQTAMARAAMRDLLANPDAPIAWSAARGGALGKRSGALVPDDKRVVLSPWQGWYVLAAPADLAPLTTAAGGNVDRVEARGKLPGWLAGIRAIAKESGEDHEKGPALVLTIGAPPSTSGPAKSGRYKLPELGLGVRSLPVPSRVSLAMELVKQGWLVRGNITFASEADAAELVTTLTGLQTRITDSHILSALLRKQHVLNVVTGLSLARAGARVSYATSISIADARAILAATAVELAGYFGPAP